MEKEEMNEYSKLIDKNAMLNNQVMAYIKQEKNEEIVVLIFQEAQELVYDIAKYINSNYRKTLSLKRYEELLYIIHSWRRFYTARGKYLSMPKIETLLSVTPLNAAKKSDRLMLRGTVIKISGEKTIKVEVLHAYTHEVYGKIVRSKKAYLVHDEQKRALVGDEVIIASCRPISKRKRFRLFRIIKSAQQENYYSEFKKTLYTEK